MTVKSANPFWLMLCQANFPDFTDTYHHPSIFLSPFKRTATNLTLRSLVCSFTKGLSEFFTLLNASRNKLPLVDFFTVRNSTCGKVMFSQARVKNCVQGAGACLPWGAGGGVHPSSRHPSGPPPLPQRRPLQRTVRILLECILVHLLSGFLLAAVGSGKVTDVYGLARLHIWHLHRHHHRRHPITKNYLSWKKSIYTDQDRVLHNEK